MKTKMVIGVMAILAIAAVAVKLVFFPTIKDDYFSMNERNLRQVPSDLVVVRPTHFPKALRKGIVYDNFQKSGKQVWRMMGRNITLQQLMAAAYDQTEYRVVLPPGTPETNFDFLVTASGDQRQCLQTAIRKRLGYVAHKETRDETVLAMKVQDPSLPGLAVSDANTKPNVHPEKDRLYFSHTRLQELTDGLEHMLDKPVVDKTDLTNFYDFSTAWNLQTRRQLDNGPSAADPVLRKILSGWGLGLVQDTDQIEMLVVKSTN